MHCVILLTFILFKLCASSVLFRIRTNSENGLTSDSYLIGTVHVAQNLIWPYLSNDTLRMINESDQIWMEQDFTDPSVRKYIYRCAIDKLSSKQWARLRARTWSQFLNETKGRSDQKSNIEEWRQWFTDQEDQTNQYLWRNQTITNDILFDHRLILEGYRRGISVGSLESLPNICVSTPNLSNRTKSNYQILLSRAYNCDIINDQFVRDLERDSDGLQLKTRNEQIAQHIRKLLARNPQQKFLFAVGAAHLFGDHSRVRMLQDQSHQIEQIDSPSQHFPSDECTNEEFQRLINEMHNSLNQTTVSPLDFH